MRLIHRQSQTHDGQDRAILGSDVDDVIRRLDAAAAGHADRNDRGIAGDVLSDMRSENACIEVVAAATPERMMNFICLPL